MNEQKLPSDISLRRLCLVCLVESLQILCWSLGAAHHSTERRQLQTEISLQSPLSGDIGKLANSLLYFQHQINENQYKTQQGSKTVYVSQYINQDSYIYFPYDKTVL